MPSFKQKTRKAYHLKDQENLDAYTVFLVLNIVWLVFSFGIALAYAILDEYFLISSCFEFVFQIANIVYLALS